MLTEHDWIQERIRLSYLVKEHPDWGARRLGKALGHDSKWAAKWKARIRATSSLTMDVFRSQSRAPHHAPQRIQPEAKSVVVDLRTRLTERFHRSAGARTIQYGLEQYRQQHPDGPKLPQSRSTIYHILHEFGCIVPPRSRWHEPLVLPPPMEEWEMDFGEIFLVDDETVFEFFMVVDRGSSRLVYLEGSTGYTAETALEALVRLFQLVDCLNACVLTVIPVYGAHGHAIVIRRP